MFVKSLQRAHRRDVLASSFERVPLGFKLLGGPIDPRNPKIVQLDIRDSPRFGEYFRIWPGAPENELEVLGFVHDLRQLVLRVKEEPRPFTQELPRWRGETRGEVEARLRHSGARVVGEHGKVWIVERTTPEEERRFLCGKDDVRLFIAQIPRGTTVEEAHAALRPEEVRRAERRWPGRILRQGEWFFLPLPDEERADLERHLATHPRWPARERPVGSGGRPHVADELVKIDRRIKRVFGELRDEAVYARGAVRHTGHNVLHLDDWRRVVRNREITGQGQRLRMWWID